MSKATQHYSKGHFQLRDVHWPHFASCGSAKRRGEGAKRLCKGKQVTCSSCSTALSTQGPQPCLWEANSTLSSWEYTFHFLPCSASSLKDWTHPRTPESLALRWWAARRHTLTSKVLWRREVAKQEPHPAVQYHLPAPSHSFSDSSENNPATAKTCCLGKLLHHFT